MFVVLGFEFKRVTHWYETNKREHIDETRLYMAPHRQPRRTPSYKHPVPLAPETKGTPQETGNSQNFQHPNIQLNL